jgi:hypothetical protein
LFTVAVGKLNVDVAVMVAVGVIVGVNVSVGRVVAVGVNVPVGIVVSVAGATVGDRGMTVAVPCCPEAGAQALASSRTNRIIFNLI